MKGYLAINRGNRTEIFKFIISRDTVKDCKRLSWFSFQAKEERSWQSFEGRKFEIIPAHLKARGHIYFKKNPSIKHLAKTLSNGGFIQDNVSPEMIKLIPLTK